MSNWVVSQSIDLVRGNFTTSPVSRRYLVGDDQAHTWQIAIANDSVPADLSKFIATAYMIRPDGATVIIEGVIEKNVISFTFPEQTYAIAGRVRGLARIAMGMDKKVITISEIFLDVIEGITDKIVDPGEIVPGIDELLALISELRGAITDANESINDILQDEIMSTYYSDIRVNDECTEIQVDVPPDYEFSVIHKMGLLPVKISCMIYQAFSGGNNYGVNVFIINKETKESITEYYYSSDEL